MKKHSGLPINFLESAIMLVTVLQWLILASITGLVVGTGASFFLHGLFFMTDASMGMPLWAYWISLPTAGLLNGLLLFYGYKLLNKDNLKDSLFAAVHLQNGLMPWRTVLIKPIAAIITLASGGSAGKEGPCSHLGAALGSMLGRLFKLNTPMRKRIVACGVSAGFASVFGTPLAGAIYGVEVLTIGRIRYDFLFPAVIASITSYQISIAWGVPYEQYFVYDLPSFSQNLFLKIILIGIFSGVVARIFVDMVYAVRNMFAKIRTKYELWPPLMPFAGGCILATLIIFIPIDYLGLSLPIMDHALQGDQMPFFGFFWKTLLVAITLGSGFYGGIVTPQFVIGAIAGNAFASLIGVSPELGAAVGLVSVVAAASNTPIAAIFMGVELFGGVAGTLYVAGAAMAAYLIVGHRSVYPDQLLGQAKTSWLYVHDVMPVGQEKIHLSHGLLKSWRQLRAKNIWARWRK